MADKRIIVFAAVTALAYVAFGAAMFFAGHHWAASAENAAVGGAVPKERPSKAENPPPAYQGYNIVAGTIVALTPDSVSITEESAAATTTVSTTDTTEYFQRGVPKDPSQYEAEMEAFTARLVGVRGHGETYVAPSRFERKELTSSDLEVGMAVRIGMESHDGGLQAVSVEVLPEGTSTTGV